MINQLLNINQQIQHRFTLAKSGQNFDFYEDIKPFVHQVDQIITSLKQNQSKITKLPYYNEYKLQQLIKLLEEVSVECHYSSTSRKLFLEKMKVIHHDLTYIKEKGEHRYV